MFTHGEKPALAFFRVQINDLKECNLDLQHANHELVQRVDALEREVKDLQRNVWDRTMFRVPVVGADGEQLQKMVCVSGADVPVDMSINVPVSDVVRLIVEHNDIAVVQRKGVPEHLELLPTGGEV